MLKEHKLLLIHFRALFYFLAVDLDSNTGLAIFRNSFCEIIQSTEENVYIKGHRDCVFLNFAIAILIVIFKDFNIAYCRF